MQARLFAFNPACFPLLKRNAVGTSRVVKLGGSLVFRSASGIELR